MLTMISGRVLTFFSLVYPRPHPNFLGSYPTHSTRLAIPSLFSYLGHWDLACHLVTLQRLVGPSLFSSLGCKRFCLPFLDLVLIMLYCWIGSSLFFSLGCAEPIFLHQDSILVNTVDSLGSAQLSWLAPRKRPDKASLLSLDFFDWGYFLCTWSI